MATERFAVRIPVLPWYRDHCFNNRIIFPAVEAMRFLALTVQAAHPALEVRRMEQCRLARFLEITPKIAELEVVIELEWGDSGDLCARLLTKNQLKTMTRMINHCELFFAAGPGHDDGGGKRPPDSFAAPEMAVTAERVYRELVPFGPAYRTLQGQLLLDKESAWGTLRAPVLPYPPQEPIGSPFPLDGAMHAACVHGQRLVDFVPFPVGFASRRIARPTRAGEDYGTCVRLQSRAADELVYELSIFDQGGQLRETVKGLRMRDVSGGRIKPPAWIRSAPGAER